MRAITERLIFREAATAELWVFDGAGDVAISSDESLLATGSTDRTIAIFSLAAVADESALQPQLRVLSDTLKFFLKTTETNK